MSLKTGECKINISGVEATLAIDSVDQNSGAVSGSITGPVSGSFTGLGSFEGGGIWDETSRTLTFLAVHQLYKGFLFSTPRNPEPGQDVVWTLAGFVQVTDLPTAIQNGGNARRNVFGWFAQITEVA